MPHLTRPELDSGLPEILQSPRDAGILKMIVQRPAVDERCTVQEGMLTLEEGLVGDSWISRRKPHLDRQITLMNARVIALLAPDPDRWPLAGDQLYVDLDLSVRNLPPGAQLRVGGALLGVTALPHRGCRKFQERFGRDAVEFVNSEAGCSLNLRGINARVIEAGSVRVNDVARVERRGAGEPC